MHRILVLGAGLVSRPLVRYLLTRPDSHVTVATRTVSKAVKLIGGHHRGEAIAFDIRQHGRLEDLVEKCDVAVSLLPATLHVQVAKLCIQHGRSMVTTSYLSSEMRELDAEAKAAGVTILNEVGVDPGIDHMSAMRVIDGVKTKGGRVTSFRSYCGGLPAPEANDNPLGYKFSWSPRAVLVAAGSPARYLEKGQEVRVDGKDLFSDSHTLDVEGLGEFEAYPNRDALGYIDLYDLQGIETMYRGTLRNLGHCETWKKMAGLGLFDPSERQDLAGLTYAEFMNKLAGERISGAGGREAARPPETTRARRPIAPQDVLRAVATCLGLQPDSPPIQKLAWLDLFSEERIPEGLRAPIDIVAARMLEKCPYREGERDMIVLVHQFEASYPDGKSEGISSTLIDFGIPKGDSSMSRTVSLPAAIATRRVAEGAIHKPGVRIPVEPALYDPILNGLEELGISCNEKHWEITA